MVNIQLLYKQQLYGIIFLVFGVAFARSFCFISQALIVWVPSSHFTYLCVSYCPLRNCYASYPDLVVYINIFFILNYQYLFKITI